MSSEEPRVLLFTGDGKGKTTAALGMSMRAVGHGMRVCFVQFVKDSRISTGEVVFMERSGLIEFIGAGLGKVPPPENEGFEHHAEAAVKGLQHAGETLRSGGCEILVLDEICIAVWKGLVGVEDVRKLIRSASGGQVIAMTGRHAPAELIDAADTVTEMRCVKHAFESGRGAREGVEM